PYGKCQMTTTTKYLSVLKQLRVVGAAVAVMALAGTFSPTLQAEVRLPKIFGSHMVLQQSKSLPVWGWAQPGETVTVQFLGESKSTQANDRGEWKVVLSPV